MASRRFVPAVTVVRVAVIDRAVAIGPVRAIAGLVIEPAQRAAIEPAQRAVADRGSGQKKAAAQRGGGARPGGGGGGHNAFANSGAGRGAMAQASRGHASLGGHGGGGMRMGGGGGGARMGGGGGRGGGGGGRGGGGGGRRSDIALKHDISLIGHLDNGLGFYRFSYNGSDKAYVGVMAQEVQTVRPDAVIRGRDGYLRVFYDKLGVKFETYDQWLASGARIPSTVSGSH